MAPVGHVVVDARGLRCPLPVVRLAAVARSVSPGSLVTVRWTDPAARHDVAAWARMRGHAVELVEPDAALDGAAAWATTVRVGTSAGPATWAGPAGHSDGGHPVG